MWEGHHGTGGTAMSVVHVYGTVLSCPISHVGKDRAGGTMSLAFDCTCVYLYSCPVLSNMSRVVSAVGIQVSQ